MRVFLSWSKRRSHEVAKAWRDFLPDVLQVVKTFISSADLEAGVRWTADLADALGDMDHGIIIVTPENREEPWIHFEAGALSKKPGKSKVVPFLYDVDGSQVHPSLAQVNYRSNTREGVMQIVTSINNDLGEFALDMGRLTRAFEKHFPDFESKLKAIPPLTEDEQKGVKPERKVEDMVAEMLRLMRQGQRSPRLANEDKRLAVMARFNKVFEAATLLSQWLLMEGRDKTKDADFLGEFQASFQNFVMACGNQLTSALSERLRIFYKIVERWDAEHMPEASEALDNANLFRDLLVRWQMES